VTGPGRTAVVARVFLVSALVMAGLGAALLARLVPVAGETGVIAGGVCLVFAAADGALGLWVLRHDART